jgi:hypothetical protein
MCYEAGLNAGGRTPCVISDASRRRQPRRRLLYGILSIAQARRLNSTTKASLRVQISRETAAEEDRVGFNFVLSQIALKGEIQFPAAR